MTKEIGFSVKEKLLAKTLNCEPQIVRSLWYQLKLDNFENIHNIKLIKEVSKTYAKMVELTQSLHKLYEKLPEDEKTRLLIQAQLLGQQTQENNIEALLNDLNKELCGLLAHRKHVEERNPSRGGKDPRADQLAEFVACIFEASERPITYGHRENKPTTDFGRAVQKTLEICDAILLETDYNIYPSNWRQPAYKAFVRRNT